MSSPSGSARVNIDYHVQVDGAFYSVPYQLAGREVEVRRSAAVIEVFHGGHRVASHGRALVRGRFVTAAEHMPAAHRRHLEWTPSRLIAWGESVGPATGALVDFVSDDRSRTTDGKTYELAFAYARFEILGIDYNVTAD